MQIPVFERFPWLFWVLMAVVVVVVLLVLFAIRSRRRLWKAALGLSIWLILSCSCAGLGSRTSMRPSIMRRQPMFPRLCPIPPRCPSWKRLPIALVSFGAS